MKLVKFFGITMMLILCAGFTSCSDDDDDENNFGSKGELSKEQMLIGSWLHESGEMKWVFNSDGKFEEWFSSTSLDWERGVGGTWYMDGYVIVLDGGDDNYLIRELTQEKLVIMFVEEGHYYDHAILTFYRM